jgi:hypothetical protein
MIYPFSFKEKGEGMGSHGFLMTSPSGSLWSFDHFQGSSHGRASD